MIEPTTDDVLAAVIGAVERDIAPACAGDDYAASLCRTVAQMLRSVGVRVQVEQHSLTLDNADLRELLGAVEGLPPGEARQARAAVADEPAPRYAAVDELRDDARRLRAALAAAVTAAPDQDAPVRRAAREYLRRHLEREREWQQDAYTGPRR